MTESSDKQEFMDRLDRFQRGGGSYFRDVVYGHASFSVHRCDRLFARALLQYLRDRPVSGDTLGINWYRDLKYHIVDAFKEFRSGEDWMWVRDAFRAEHQGQPIFDPVDIHVGGLTRTLGVEYLAHLMAVISGEAWVYRDLGAYFNAQWVCVDQAWRDFVRRGYRELMPRIREERHRGNTGTFGSTTLHTYVLAGRCMFTFQRGGEDITYVADESDMSGERSGPNTTDTPYHTCVSMIDEVTSLWDCSRMVRSDTVGIG